MSETKNTGEKTIVMARRPLGLKRGTNIERDTVRQSFSHGRTNTVQVERKKRRVVLPGEQKLEPPPPPPVARAEPVEVETRTAAEESRAAARAGLVLRQLSSDEIDARARALADARVEEAEQRRQAETVAARRAAEGERQARERAEAERRQAEEDARRQAEEAARQRAEDAARRRFGEEVRKPDGAAVPGRVTDLKALKEVEEEDEAPAGFRSRAKVTRPAEPKPVRRVEERRRGKLTLANALDDTERARSLASIRRRRERERARAHEQGPREKVVREVVIPETITIQELAGRMAERSVEVIKVLMKQGQMVKAADVIDADTAQLIAEEMGHSVRRVAEADVEEGLFASPDAEADVKPRPPVVTVMGHVDHGKTSLLDAIRKTSVVSGEAGGITQHIGAYQVEHKGHQISFIDTPGHAAFTAMRARGAKVTDIVVLVVAADDGVMPQTVEAINHAKAAGVPIIVAINKIDKPDADPKRVRSDLLQREVFVESMGGEVLDVEVSALTGANLDRLLDTILLQAEVMELGANPDHAAEGTVIEAQLDRGRGAVATALVQQGTLRVGDILVAGAAWGRVRALVDDRGEPVKEAGPSTPVEVLGFQEAPEAGDRFAAVDNEGRARDIAAYRARQKRDKALALTTAARGSLEQMMSQLKVAGRKDFPLVIKGDVQGSVEAITQALAALGTDEVAARVIHSGVGGITESDVTLAATSSAAIIGFNVRANKQAREAAERDGIEIRYYNIIYNLVDDVKAAMSGLLPPERRETMLGNAEILEIFDISKVGKIAGCRVTEGTVERGANVRLIRDNVVIHEGKLSTLKRFKDEAREVPAGQECGMAFERYQDMRVGDVIECYRVEEIARTL
ncbi:MAG: translation initiation factor IF-2 [Bauldia sp.]